LALAYVEDLQGRSRFAAAIDMLLPVPGDNVETQTGQSASEGGIKLGSLDDVVVGKNYRGSPVQFHGARSLSRNRAGVLAGLSILSVSTARSDGTNYRESGEYKPAPNFKHSRNSPSFGG
jgi:hypothetical protein